MFLHVCNYIHISLHEFHQVGFTAQGPVELSLLADQGRGHKGACCLSTMVSLSIMKHSKTKNAS